MHKRSKSSLALSLLHRDRSKGDEKTEDGPGLATSDTESPTPSINADSPTSSTAPTHLGIGRWHSSRSKRREADDEPAPSMPQIAQDQATKSASRPPPQEKATSIEQSVRLFRLFEALRNGDTAAILKSIKESSSLKSTEGDGGQSSHGPLEGTSILHLAVQCAEPQVVEYVITTAITTPGVAIDFNARDREGNTPLHLAVVLSRAQIVRLLLAQIETNDLLTNYQGRTPLDLARNPDIYQQLQLSRSLFHDNKVRQIQNLVVSRDFDGLEKLLEEPRVGTAIDVNATELVAEPVTIQTGGTLLHEAARKRETRLIQILLMHGADPFRRDRKGKLPQDVTKDEGTRGVLKKSPAAVAAQKGIQERAILGNNAGHSSTGTGSVGDPLLAGKDSREMKGYLKKWTNYTSGYKLRWFVLEDGVLSYYKNQGNLCPSGVWHWLTVTDDAGSACRGAINMRIAKLHIDSQDKTRFEIQGKSSVKYHLKANHVVEAKRWFWALNNAIQWTKDEAREEEKRKGKDAERLRQAREEQLERTQRLTEKVGDSASISSRNPGGKGLVNITVMDTSMGNGPSASLQGSTLDPGSAVVDDISAHGSYEPSLTGNDVGDTGSYAGIATLEGALEEDEEDGDDVNLIEVQPTTKDAFNITAQSAKIQIDLLTQVTAALQLEKTKEPELTISNPTMLQAISVYESAVRSLRDLLGDLLRISRDRDAYWQYRLDREVNVRSLWEESMARVAREQEKLEGRIGESEDKRKRTKRALRHALEGSSAVISRPGSREISTSRDGISEAFESTQLSKDGKATLRRNSGGFRDTGRKKSVITELVNLSDSGSEDDEEFFDAVDAGEVEVVTEMPTATSDHHPLVKCTAQPKEDVREDLKAHLAASFKGYEEPVRKRLKLDVDNRPQISLWVSFSYHSDSFA